MVVRGIAVELIDCPELTFGRCAADETVRRRDRQIGALLDHPRPAPMSACGGYVAGRTGSSVPTNERPGTQNFAG